MGRACGDDPVLGGKSLPIQPYGMVIHKSRRPELHLGPQFTESLLGVMLLNHLDDPLDSSGHFAKVNRFDFHRREPELSGILDQMIDVGGLDQGFAGNATEMQAVSTKLLFFLHEQGFRSQLSGSRSYRQTSRPPS